MALADLATIDDLDVRGITLQLDTTEQVLVDTLLTVASSMVRDAAGVPITEATSTVVIDGYRCEPWLPLPGQPVREVDAVELDGTEVTDWRLASGRLWRRAGWSRDDGPGTVQVTMTHGLTSVPEDIVDLVCAMVAAGLKASRTTGDGTGLAARDSSIQSRSVTIDDYSESETYASGADAAVTAPTAMSLPKRTRDALRSRFGGTAGTVTSR